MMTETFLAISIGIGFLTLSYFFSLYKLKLSSASGYDIQKYFEFDEKNDTESAPHHSFTQNAIVSLGISRIMINTLFLALVFW